MKEIDNTSDSMLVEQQGDGVYVYRRADSPEHEEYSYQRPYILELELTRRCNLKCSHCYAEAPGDGSGEVEFEEIDELLRDAVQLGIPELSLSGGEATLHPHFLDIWDLATELGLGVRFVTNGTTADEQLVAELSSRPLNLVTVSLDAVDPAVHDSIRGPGAHAAAFAGLERMVEAGLPLSMITAFCKTNIGEFEALRDLCGDWGIDWQVQMTSLKGRCPSELILSPDEYYELGRKTAEVLVAGSPVIVPMDDLATFSRFPPLTELSKTWQDRCSGGVLNIFVRADGGVTPCSALASDRAVVGNIREHPLSVICAEERCRKDLEWLNVSRLEGVCGSCPHRRRCYGGCPDILLTMCRSPNENDYCFYKIEADRILDSLL